MDPLSRRAGVRGLSVLVLLAASLVWSGCGEDLGFGDSASIVGKVVDSAGDPIFQVRIGVVYESLMGAPGPSGLGPETATLQGPYPNPSFGSLSIPVLVDAPDSVRVEVLGTFGGVTGPVALVFNDWVTQDTTFSWDGRDNFDDPAPNGLYAVRVSSPPGQEAVDLAVVLNRSSAQLRSLDIFNTLSDADGDYFLDDLAVEQSFVATNGTGQTLGRAILAARVVLAFWDPEYIDRDVTVAIGQGETVEIETQLNSFLAAPGRVPGTPAFE